MNRHGKAGSTAGSGPAGRLPRRRDWVNSWLEPPHADPHLSFWRVLRPVQLLVGSFVLVILSGTVGLRFLPGLYTGPGLGWLDALFTATSAVCVTGLIVVDTATYFTPLGQAFLLLLIQLGGLGILSFATFIILGLGGRLSLRQEQLSLSMAEVAPHIDFRHLARSIVRLTLLIEAAGAIVLWLAWTRAGLGPRNAVWPAVFHSVSAFCNAGFSTFTDSLIGFRQDPAILAPILALIILGGLGFLVLEEAWVLRHLPAGLRARRVSLHTRIVLVSSAGLLLGGWLLFGLLEWNGTLAGMPIPARVTNALFMSVTPRTAGFNTIDYSQVTEGTGFLTVILMFLGGSPGSTAGGVKTTTVALLVLLAWTRLRGRRSAVLWGRTVPEETLQRATGLFVTAFTILTGAILLLTVAGLPAVATAGVRGDFLARMFEAGSALGTVGLSMGLTPELTALGKGITVGLMLIGRVGALAVAAAIAAPERRSVQYRYAYEDVIVG